MARRAAIPTPRGAAAAQAEADSQGRAKLMRVSDPGCRRVSRTARAPHRYRPAPCRAAGAANPPARAATTPASGCVAKASDGLGEVRRDSSPSRSLPMTEKQPFELRLAVGGEAGRQRRVRPADASARRAWVARIRRGQRRLAAARRLTERAGCRATTQSAARCRSSAICSRRAQRSAICARSAELALMFAAAATPRLHLDRRQIVRSLDPSCCTRVMPQIVVAGDEADVAQVVVDERAVRARGRDAHSERRGALGWLGFELRARKLHVQAGLRFRPSALLPTSAEPTAPGRSADASTRVGRHRFIALLSPGSPAGGGSRGDSAETVGRCAARR